MKSFAFGAGLLLVLASATATHAGDAATESQGKKIFLDNKCNACHSIKSQGIGVDETAAGGDEGEAGDGGKSPKPPDLSNEGNSKHDAKFLDEWLRKQVDIDGRKHMRRFPGTKEERATLIAWLLTLKSEAKK